MENISIIYNLIIRGDFWYVFSIFADLIGIFLLIAQHNSLQSRLLIRLKEIFISYWVTFLFSLIFFSLKFLNFKKIDFLIAFFTFSIFLYNSILDIVLKRKNIPSLELKKPDFKDYKKGTIYLGHILHNQEIFRKFKLNIEDLKRHMIIYGQTGTGKTTFLNNFLHQFENFYPSIPFIFTSGDCI